MPMNQMRKVHSYYALSLCSPGSCARGKWRPDSLALQRLPEQSCMSVNCFMSH